MIEEKIHVHPLSLVVRDPSVRIDLCPEAIDLARSELCPAIIEGVVHAKQTVRKKIPHGQEKSEVGNSDWQPKKTH